MEYSFLDNKNKKTQLFDKHFRQYDIYRNYYNNQEFLGKKKDSNFTV